MSPEEVGINAGALVLAFMVVRFAEFALKKYSERGGSSGSGGSAGLEQIVKTQQAIERGFEKLAETGERQLDALRSLSEDLGTDRVEARLASREQAVLQKSVDKLHDRLDKMIELSRPN